MKYSLCALWFVAVCPVLANAQSNASPPRDTAPVYRDLNRSFEDRAADLVARMTLEEKIAQLGNDAPAIPRLDVPAYEWWNEALHGVARAGAATVFPQAIGLAATFDTRLMREVATAIGDEARAKHHEFARRGKRGRYQGLTFWSPNINIFRDPRWGRGQETYGEDPYLTGRMGVEFVKALQGDDPKYRKVDATAKHFAVHSGPEASRHRFDARPDERDLYETYLPAFQALVQEGKVASVMGAYNRLYGESASASPRLLQRILRDDWGFRGYVVSDCDSIEDIFLHHKIVDTAEKAAALAVKNGCDLDCGKTYAALVPAVKQGLVKQSDIDVALRRLMLTRFQLGMFDPPQNVRWAQIPYSENQSPAHDELSRRAAQSSIVLLKNDGLLPLSPDIGTLAVIGPTADEILSLLGNYYGTPAAPVTVLKGIRNAVGPKTRVLYARGADLVEGREEPRAAGDDFSAKPPFEEAIDAARAADAVVFVGGLTGDVEGEEMSVSYPGFAGGDRTDLRLPATQRKLLEALHATGKPVVLVLTAGSAIAVDWARQKLPAILVAWYPGQRGGSAVADVLFGRVNPAGRLPVTFYKADEKLPAFDDYSMQGRTYRYFKGVPLYPFGHGLSYTRFEYSDLQIDRERTGRNEPVNVTVSVKNSGSRAGEEVVQLYLKPRDAKRVRAIKELRGVERISLNAGEERRVSFAITPSRDLRHYDVNTHAYAVDAGRYEVQVGASSADIRLSRELVVGE